MAARQLPALLATNCRCGGCGWRAGAGRAAKAWFDQRMRAKDSRSWGRSPEVLSRTDRTRRYPLPCRIVAIAAGEWPLA